MLIKERRRTYFVDADVQWAIIRQAAVYWLWGTIIFTLFVGAFRIIIPFIFTGEGLSWTMVWHHLSPMVISSLFLLPVVMFSAVRFSHRIVGPMVRFRQVLTKLAAGESATQIKLRDNDFWRDVANDINKISLLYPPPACDESMSEENEPMTVG